MKHMNIGIEGQALRGTPSGIYYYVWNLLRHIGSLSHSHSVSVFLYGPQSVERKDVVDRLKAGVPNVKLTYEWDGWPFILSSKWEADCSQSYPLVRTARRGILQLWAKLHKDYPSVGFAASQQLAWLQKGRRFLPDVDLFHHTYGLVFPVQNRVNVMTIYDLIPRLFSEHYPGALAWFSESFEKARNMDLILTPSEHTKRDVMEILKVPEEKIRVTPLAANEQYRPIENREVVKAVAIKHGLGDQPYILSVGTLEYRRNLHRLVEAFGVLKRENKILNHQLILVGVKGESCNVIFEAVVKWGLEGEVRWLGHVPFEDLPALMNGADLFVYPSLYEGFGLPPLEAMACGTPVASSRVSAIPEVVGDAGIFFDPCNINEIAAAIDAVLRDDTLKKQLRTKGLLRSKMFSWDRTAELTVDAYEHAWARFHESGARTKVSRSRTKAQQIVVSTMCNDLRKRY